MKKFLFISASIAAFATTVAGCIVPAYQPAPQPYQPAPQGGVVVTAQPAPQPAYVEPQPATVVVTTAPPAPPAEPPPAPAPVYIEVAAEPAGAVVPGVEQFYDKLAPFGTWYNDPSYGWVFAPSNPGYVPYTNGHWKYTDYGFTWISSDPHGWATSHYGRWVWVNRWVWAPDTTWGPAWVTWRNGDGWAGWAPTRTSPTTHGTSSPLRTC